MSGELLTTSEACKILGFGSDTIRRMANAGSIGFIKSDSGHRRYYKSSVLALLERMQSNAAIADNADSPKK
jgi:excisionase family DNA binding protein